MPTATRRAVLAGLGTTAATGSLVLGVGAANAAADPYESQPEYVDLTFDESWLETYRPYLVTRTLDIKPTAWYAWRATSTERDTDMAVYYCYYVTQEGVSAADSHQYDREPVMVEVDQAGDVERVHVDGYHYLNKTYVIPTLTGDTHPTLHSVNPYHFYRRTEEIGDTDLQMESLHDRFEPWLENGWNVYPEAVTNPWIVPQRGHYWDEGLGGIAYNAQYWEALLGASKTIGVDIGGAQETDL